jgi:hypothetical protein
MRCDEARKRMTEGRLEDPAVAEHILTCVACAKLAAADRQLSRLLREAVETEMVPATPISIVRQRIESIAAESQRKEKRIMANVFDQFRVHPKLSWGLALAVVVFLFVSLVPFSYQRVTGYDATVAFADLPREISKESLQGALAAIGQGDAKIMLEKQNEKTIYKVRGLSSQLSARELVAVVNALAGTKGHSEIVPVLVTVSGSLFAQVRDKIITIEVSGAGKTDTQLEADISTKLTEAGLTPEQVTVTTQSDGSRQISVSTSRNAQDGSDSLQIRLDVKGDSTAGFKMISAETDENMTDAEAKAAIEARLAEQGITNAEVVVTRDAQGKRKVDVKALK